MQVAAQLQITIDTEGKVFVTGPVENKLLCYGLLEAARDVIKDYKPSPIVKPNMGAVPMNGHDSKPN